jgi:hypothetical protein
MLTYRQLLQKCNKDTLRACLADKTRVDIFYKEIPADEMEAQVTSTVDAYMRVVETMINKKGEWPTHAIILSLAEDSVLDKKTFKPTGEIEHYITTNYYNSTAEELPVNLTYDDHNNEKYHKFMGFGLLPWTEFVDCDVVVSPEVVAHIGEQNFLEHVAAEILWEQTWYGFSDAETQSFRGELLQRIADIKSGKIKTKKLKKKKDDKYTVCIPEDMLEPVKKKRSKNFKKKK